MSLRQRLGRLEGRQPAADGAPALAAERAALRLLPPEEIAARYRALRDAPSPALAAELDGLTPTELVARYRAVARLALP